MIHKLKRDQRRHGRDKKVQQSNTVFSEDSDKLAYLFYIGFFAC